MTNNKFLLLAVKLLLSISVSSFQIRRRAWDDPYCHTFDSAGVCTQCSYRYYFNQNHICTQVRNLCSAWNQTTGKCTGCYSGYQVVNGACVQSGNSQPNNNTNTNTTNNTNTDPGVDKNCKTFDANNACTQCQFRFFIKADTGICTKVSDHCKQWDNTTGACTSCYDGYTLTSGQCLL